LLANVKRQYWFHLFGPGCIPHHFHCLSLNSLNHQHLVYWWCCHSYDGQKIEVLFPRYRVFHKENEPGLRNPPHEATCPRGVLWTVDLPLQLLVVHA
jgi:hypothetical protein